MLQARSGSVPWHLDVPPPAHVPLSGAAPRSGRSAELPTQAVFGDAAAVDIADWEAQLLVEGGQGSALRHDGVLPLAAQRILDTAQGWADRAEFGGGADGWLGQAMYSRFKEFDVAYMQPLFGAEGGAASSTYGSTHLLPEVSDEEGEQLLQPRQL